MPLRSTLCSAIASLLLPHFACAQDAPASAVKTKARAASAPAAAAKKEPLVTMRGELAIRMSASAFGPGTSVDSQGNLVTRVSSPALAIEHDGKSFPIEITRQTKLDDSLKSGLIDLSARWRVSGRMRDGTIVATEIVKE